MDRIERISTGHNICYTQDNKSRQQRETMVLVRKADLDVLEKFFTLPLHQQVAQMQKVVRTFIRENKGYPRSTYLMNLLTALTLAHDLAFAAFATDLTVEEIHGS